MDLPISEDFHCWVGLNERLASDYFEINPFVGVHAPSIMKLYTALEGRKYARNIATYAIHMGEIAPSEDAFRFTTSTDIGVEANRLADLYVSDGLDYAKSISNYDDLLPLIQARVPMLGGYPERVACCLYLMGRVDEAGAFTQDFVTQQPAYFEGFAKPFLKKLDAERSPTAG